MDNDGLIILGGSFDPIHLGHLEIIEKAREYNQKILIIPTSQNPLKGNIVAPSSIRLKWINDILGDKPNIIIETYEIEKKSISFTYNTIKYIRDKFNTNNIKFLIGEDNLQSLDKWYNIVKLKKMVEFVVISRGDYANTAYMQIANKANSSDIRNGDMSFVPKNIKKEVKKFYENK